MQSIGKVKPFLLPSSRVRRIPAYTEKSQNNTIAPFCEKHNFPFFFFSSPPAAALLLPGRFPPEFTLSDSEAADSDPPFPDLS